MKRPRLAKRWSRKLWAVMRAHERTQQRRSDPTPPSGEVFLTDVDGAILTDVDGSYLTQKE